MCSNFAFIDTIFAKSKRVRLILLRRNKSRLPISRRQPGRPLPFRHPHTPEYPPGLPRIDGPHCRSTFHLPDWSTADTVWLIPGNILLPSSKTFFNPSPGNGLCHKWRKDQQKDPTQTAMHPPMRISHMDFFLTQSYSFIMSPKSELLIRTGLFPSV